MSVYTLFHVISFLTVSQAFEPYAHEKPISIQLAAAAHHVRNTAELSLDVSRRAPVHYLSASRFRRCSNRSRRTWRRRLAAGYHTSSKLRANPRSSFVVLLTNPVVSGKNQMLSWSFIEAANFPKLHAFHPHLFS